ncbi:Ig-like domain-containing protein [Pseudomonas sp. PWP3-1b2]|uniref:Ig-like domain-containing protein n=1 Tax=Pseudomonas sp. PWP3-1b2 TaxID=2804656 RepID=UPI003CF66610
MSTIPLDELQDLPYPYYPAVNLLDLKTHKYIEFVDETIDFIIPTPPPPPYPGAPPVAPPVAPPNDPSAKWGLGIDRLTNIAIAIEAWTKLEVGDYYSCRWLDPKVPVASDYVRELKARYELLIDETKVPAGFSPMFWHVVRASLNESSSKIQWVLVKKTRPGGEDREGGDPWHSELKMSVEDLDEYSIITADTVSGGIYCLIEHYENRRRNDVITIDWGGETFTYILSAKEASGTAAIRIRVPDGKDEKGKPDPNIPNVINKGPQSGQFVVSFMVMDVVGNTSGSKHHYSKGYALQSNLNSKLLDAPSFRVNDVDEPVADLDQSEKPLFQLRTFPPRIGKKPVPPNKVKAYLKILSEDGVLIEIINVGELPDTNGQLETFTLSYEHVAKAAGRLLLAFYTVSNAAGTKTSAITPVRVVGTATQMPAPELSPIEGTLLPLDTDAIVKIPEYYPFYKTGRETVVFSQGKLGEGGLLYTDTRQAGEQGGIRDVLKENLKIFENKGPFHVHYIANNGRNLPSSIRHSEKRQAELGVRPVELPAPVVKYAEDGNIDPKNVKRSILLMWFPFVGAVPGYELVWNAVGDDHDSSDSGSILIDPSTEGHLLPELLVELKPQVLLENINGEISFSYSVQRPGTANKPKIYSRSEVLKLTVGAKVVMQTPIVVEADKLLQDEVHPKDVLSGATVRVNYTPMRDTDIIFVSWAGEFGISVTKVEARGNSKTNSVDVRIPPHIIALGIREHGNNITVQYSFSRGGTTQTSEPLAFRLKLVTELPAPTINGIKDSLFYLLALGDEVKITVDPWIMIQRNQRKFLTIEGTQADGTEFLETIYTADNVTDQEVEHGVAFTMPADKFHTLKENSPLYVKCGVSFAQRNEKNTAVPFVTRAYRVQAVQASNPAPAFDNKPGTTLFVSPLNYLGGSVISVNYPGMAKDQIITCQLLYPDGTVTDFAPHTVVAAGRVDVPINSQVIAKMVRKTVTLRYKVTTGTVRTDTKHVWSSPQILIVGTIPADQLPMARINGVAHNGQHDLATFANNATLTLAKWPFISAGQKIWITCRSVGAAQLYVLTAYEVTPADLDKGLVNIPVSRPWIERLTHEFSVQTVGTLDGSIDIENAVAFGVTLYSIKGQLKVNQQAMILNGVSIKDFPATKKNADSYRNVETRVATGGAGDYTYSSTNPRVASVDKYGKVTGNANGSAEITISDKNLTKISYTVYVSNVFRFVFDDRELNYTDAWAWAASVGGTHIFDAAIYDLGLNYSDAQKHLVGRWAYASAGCQPYFVTYYDDVYGIYCRPHSEKHRVMCLKAV